VFAGPRRLGKTSFARAVLEVCRAADASTVAVDLFAKAFASPTRRLRGLPLAAQFAPGRYARLHS
jgi:hypothetical protein